MKNSYILSLLLFHTITLSVFPQTDRKEKPLLQQISIESGTMAAITSADMPSLAGSFTRIRYTNYLYNHWGYQTGLTLTSGLPSCKMLYTIPVQVCFRTNTFSSNINPEETDNFGESILWSIVNLIPMNLELNAGLSLGYANTKPIVRDPITKLAYEREYYAATQNVSTSIDAGAKLNFQLWHLNFFIAPQISYTPIRNFYYYSDYGRQKSKSQVWFSEISGGMGLQF